MKNNAMRRMLAGALSAAMIFTSLPADFLAEEVGGFTEEAVILAEDGTDGTAGEITAEETGAELASSVYDDALTGNSAAETAEEAGLAADAGEADASEALTENGEEVVDSLDEFDEIEEFILDEETVPEEEEFPEEDLWQEDEFGEAVEALTENAAELAGDEDEDPEFVRDEILFAGGSEQNDYILNADFLYELDESEWEVVLDAGRWVEGPGQTGGDGDNWVFEKDKFAPVDRFARFVLDENGPRVIVTSNDELQDTLKHDSNCIRATIYVHDAYRAQLTLHVRFEGRMEEGAAYEEPFDIDPEHDEHMLINQTWDLPAQIRCRIEEHDWDETGCFVEGMNENIIMVDADEPSADDITSYEWVEDPSMGEGGYFQESKDPIVEIEEAENGWRLHAVRTGMFILEWSHNLRDGALEGENDGGVHTVKFYVDGHRDFAEALYPSNGRSMLPDVPVQVDFRVRHEWNDEEYQYGWEYVDDYQILLEDYEDRNDNPFVTELNEDETELKISRREDGSLLLTAEVTEDGKSVTVTAEDAAAEYDDSFWIPVQILIYDLDENGNRRIAEDGWDSYDGFCVHRFGYDFEMWVQGEEFSYIELDPDVIDELTIGAQIDLEELYQEGKLKVKTVYANDPEHPIERQALGFWFDGFDQNPWQLKKEELQDDKGRSLPTALLRTRTWETGFNIEARYLEKADDDRDYGEDIWGEGTSGVGGRFFLPQEDYHVCVVSDDVEIRDDEPVRFFADDNPSFKADLSQLPVSLSDEDWEISWEIGFGDKDGWHTIEPDDDPQTPDPYGIFEDGTRMTVNGEALRQILEDNNRDWCEMRFEVGAFGEGVSGWGTGMNVYRYEYQDHFGHEQMRIWDEDDLDGQDAFVRNRDYPEGENVPVLITGYKAIEWDQDDDGNPSEYDPEGDVAVRIFTDNEGRYKVRAERYGYLNVELTYVLDDEASQGTPVEARETHTAYKEFNVNPDNYFLEFHYPENDERILMGRSVVIQTTLRHEWRYEDGDGGEEEVDGYNLYLDGEYNTDLVSAKITAGDNGNPAIRVRAGNQRGDTWIPVRAVLRTEDGQEFDAHSNFRIEVDSDFHFIMPDELIIENEEGDQEQYQPQLGEILDVYDFDPRLFYRTPDEENEEITGEDFDSEFRFRLDYDSDAWTPVARAGEDRPDPLVPALMRVKPWDTKVRLRAEHYDGEEEDPQSMADDDNWNEWTNREYWFGRLNYEVSLLLDYEDEYGNPWVFDNQVLDLKLDPEELAALPEGVYPEWHFGVRDEENDCLDEEYFGEDADTYYQVAADGSHAMIDGEKLFALTKDDPDVGGINLEVRLVYGDDPDDLEEVGGFGRYVGSKEHRNEGPHLPGMNEDGEREDWTLSGWGYRVWDNALNLYVEDADHPYGEEIPIPVEISVPEQQRYDDGVDGFVPLTEEELKNSPLVEVMTEGGSTTIYPVEGRFGRAKVQFAFTMPEESENDPGKAMEVWFWLNVVGDMYTLDFLYPDGSDQMLPGSSMTIRPLLYRDYFDENNEYKYYTLEPDEFSLRIGEDENGNPAYNTDLVDVTIEASGEIKVTSKGSEGETGIWLNACLPRLDGEGKPIRDGHGDVVYDEVSGGNVHVRVWPGYAILFPDEDSVDLSSLAITETTEITPVYRYYNDEVPEGEDAQDIRFIWKAQWNQERLNDAPFEITDSDGEVLTYDPETGFYSYNSRKGRFELTDASCRNGSTFTVRRLQGYRVNLILYACEPEGDGYRYEEEGWEDRTWARHYFVRELDGVPELIWSGIGKEPTCTERGSEGQQAVDAQTGEYYAAYVTELDPTGHQPDTGTVTKEPSCTEEGELIYKCIFCGEDLPELTQTLAKTDHVYGEWVTSQDGRTRSRTCENCGDVQTEDVSEEQQKLEEALDALQGAGDDDDPDAVTISADPDAEPGDFEKALAELAEADNDQIIADNAQADPSLAELTAKQDEALDGKVIRTSVDDRDIQIGIDDADIWEDEKWQFSLAGTKTTVAAVIADQIAMLRGADEDERLVQCEWLSELDPDETDLAYHARMDVALNEAIDPDNSDNCRLEFDLVLNIFDQYGNMVAENVQPVAPLTVTAVTSEEWQSLLFDLVHVAGDDDGNEQEQPVAYEWNSAHTGICFAAGSFSLYRAKNIRGHEHHWVKTGVKTPATCTEPGIEIQTCENSDECNAKTREVEIEPLGHLLSHTPETDPDKAGAGVDGSIEYWHCSRCGEYFLDKQCEESITADDLEKVNAAWNAIGRLPAAEEIGVNDKAAVEAAEAAINALDESLQDLVGNADTLEEAKQALASAQKVADVISKISALPAASAITAADKDKVDQAQAAYDALSPEEQAKVSNAASLAEAGKAVEAAVKKASADQAAANDVAAKINALPANAGVSDEAAVNAARAAYNALSNDQKKLVSAAALSKLSGAESSVTNAKNAAKADAAAAAEAAKFRLNVANGAKNVPVLLKKNNKNIHVVTLGTGDALKEAASADAKTVTAKIAGSNIVLKGLKAGKSAQITVTTKLGGKVVFTVKVQKKASALKAKGIKMAKTTTLKKGETFDITTVINPVTTPDKMKFTLDKKGKKVISVSKKGLITAKNAGTAKLTIQVGKKKKVVTVKVQ